MSDKSVDIFEFIYKDTVSKSFYELKDVQFIMFQKTKSERKVFDFGTTQKFVIGVAITRMLNLINPVLVLYPEASLVHTKQSKDFHYLPVNLDETGCKFLIHESDNFFSNLLKSQVKRINDLYNKYNGCYLKENTPIPNNYTGLGIINDGVIVEYTTDDTLSGLSSVKCPYCEAEHYLLPSHEFCPKCGTPIVLLGVESAKNIADNILSDLDAN